jgi:hypothetical protein
MAKTKRPDLCSREVGTRVGLARPLRAWLAWLVFSNIGSSTCVINSKVKQEEKFVPRYGVRSWSDGEGKIGPREEHCPGTLLSMLGLYGAVLTSSLVDHV